ncbi:hypothetical protein RI367_006253 [Sorochytrium milnesiophthora]
MPHKVPPQGQQPDASQDARGTEGQLRVPSAGAPRRRQELPPLSRGNRTPGATKSGELSTSVKQSLLHLIGEPEDAKEQARAKAKAMWQNLRAYVSRRYFSSFVVSPVNDLQNFATLVEMVWAKMVKGYRARVHLSNMPLSATAQSAAQLTNAPERHDPRHLRPSALGVADQRGLLEMPLHVLSLTHVTGLDVARAFNVISRGLSVMLDDEQEDYFNAQIQYTRGWKILVLGLELPESFHRYLALIALRNVMPFITKTLPDLVVRETLARKLLHLFKSDERAENRQKAVFLLGQLGVYLGVESEMQGLMQAVFHDVAVQVLHMQVYQRRSKGKACFTQADRSLKIYLINALGKFLRPLNTMTARAVPTKHGQLPITTVVDSLGFDVLDLTLYLIYTEFAHCEACTEGATSTEASAQEQSHMYFVLRSLLGVLNSQFAATEVFRDGVGAMFQKYVRPLMRSKDVRLQMHAVQFVSYWLPITRSDAFVQSFQMLINGLEAVRRLMPDYDADLFASDYLDFIRKQRQQEVQLALRAKILRQLIHMPGTWSRLTPATGYPGFFVDVDSALLHTQQLLVSLPIHPNSAVSIVRPLVSLPGVPTNTTTVPPVFVDLAWAAQQAPPQSAYELLERVGRIVGLPVGYTYTPDALWKETKVEAKPAGKAIGRQREQAAAKAPTPTGVQLIPKDMTLQPPKPDDKAQRGVPYGFISNNPYDAAFEVSPNKPARPPSAIFDHKDEGGDSAPGFTYQRHPLLWPSKEEELKTVDITSDFVVGAPVLFDIMEPGTRCLQRILCRVVSVGKDLSIVCVHSDGHDNEYLAIGAQFNIYVRGRDPAAQWDIVQLEILDNDHDEEIEITTRKSLTATYSPVPAGSTGAGDPYYAPPVNVLPTPAGYDQRSQPYYGRTPDPKPLPAGLTASGIAFYGPKSLDENLTKTANTYSGFDYRGRPVFVPRGCKIPSPAGFTTDGVPYYDLLSMITHRGVLFAPKLDEVRSWIRSLQGAQVKPDADISQLPEAITRFLDDCAWSWKLLQSDQTDLVNEDEELRNMLAALNGTQIKWHKRLRNQALGGSVADYLEVADRPSFEAYLDATDENTSLIVEPPDPIEFIRQFEDLAYLRPLTMKVAIEPPSVTFQSVTGSIVRSVLLKFRANRGDHQERDFFIAIHPVDVFQVQQFHLQLQGEGALEIAVTFFPTAMRYDRQEGYLSLIDDSGRKLASTTLLGLRQTFVKVSPLALNLGWILPQRSKDANIEISNISPTLISLSLATVMQVDDNNGRGGSTVTNGVLPGVATVSGVQESSSQMATQLNATSCRIQAGESFTVPVTVSPKAIGRFCEWVSIEAPGKETINVKVFGVCGVPLIVHPEDAVSSEGGPAGLSRERNLFLKTLIKHHNKSSAIVVSDKLTEAERVLLRKFMTTSHEQLQTSQIDFGLLQPGGSRKCCLTIFNMTDESVTVAIAPLHPAVKTDYLVRVAPRTANVTELSIDIPSNYPHGKFQSVVHVVAAHLDAQVLGCRAFVGQPVGFPIWRYAYFAPVPPGRQSTFVSALVNQTDYELKLVTVGPDASGASEITTGLSTLPSEPSVIPPNSSLPVKFSFTPSTAGFKFTQISLYILSPTTITVPATMLAVDLILIGISIDAVMIRQLDSIRPLLINPQRLKESLASGVMLGADPTVSQASDASHTEAGQADNASESRTDNAAAAVAAATGTLAASTVIAMNDTMIDSTLQYLVSYEPLEYLVSAQADEIKFADSQNVHRAAHPLTVESQSELPLDAAFFSSTFFSMQPRLASFGRKAAVRFDTMYLQPDANAQCTVIGFHAGVQPALPAVASLPIVARANFGFMVYPTPDNENHEIALDFGTVETGSVSEFLTQRSVLVINTYSAVISWTVRLLNVKAKYTPFTCTPQNGELRSYEAFRIPFTAATTSNGTYEVIAELLIKETFDRNARSIKLCRIVCRITCVTTMVSGIPDHLDYGSTIIGQSKSKTFPIHNTGSADIHVSLVAKVPFRASPANFVLAAGGSQDVTLTLSPYESAVFQYRLIVFCNHTVTVVSLTGTNGTADLQCASASEGMIDFGQIHENAIAWTDVYMTNCGSLSIALRWVYANRPEFLRLEFLGTSSTVPTKKKSGTAVDTIAPKKNYWAAVRKKLPLLSFLRSFSKDVLLASNKNDRKPTQRAATTIGKPIFINPSSSMGSANTAAAVAAADLSKSTSASLPVLTVSAPVANPGAASSSDALQTVDNIIPPIRPFHSYHFRVGFTTPFQTRKNTDLNFVYSPHVLDRSTQSTDDLRLAKLVLSGSIVKTLDFLPPVHDFGLAYAEQYLEVDTRPHLHLARTMQDAGACRNRMVLTVVNPGFETHNLAILSTPGYLTVSERKWCIRGGEKIEIPIEFHPMKEQTQYRGKVVFEHKYGASLVQFFGTGASADVTHDAAIDFGSLKRGAHSVRSLRLTNKGLLGAAVKLQISPSSSAFHFVGDDLYDSEQYIHSGQSLWVDVQCVCQQLKLSQAVITVRWQRIPNGKWEYNDVPLQVLVGSPAFTFDLFEMDFGTTYMGLRKTIKLGVHNPGNASCRWSAATESAFLSLSSTSGTLNSQGSETIAVTFVPSTYDMLEETITFETDAGIKSIICYGIVGVPIMQVSEEDSHLDFEIVEIGKTKAKAIQLGNTSAKQVSFEVTIYDYQRNGESCQTEPAGIFFVDTAKGVIEPFSKTPITFTAAPSEYNNVISAAYSVQTADGERYDGTLACVGGKAIIKLSLELPRSAKGGRALRPRTSPLAEISEESHAEADADIRPISSRNRTAEEERVAIRLDTPERPSSVSTVEALQVLLRAEMEAMREVVAEMSSDKSKELQAEIVEYENRRRSALNRFDRAARTGSSHSRTITPLPPPRLSRTTTPFSPANGRPQTTSTSMHSATAPSEYDQASQRQSQSGSGQKSSADNGAAAASPLGTRPGTQRLLSAKSKWLSEIPFSWDDVQRPLTAVIDSTNDVLEDLVAYDPESILTSDVAALVKQQVLTKVKETMQYVKDQVGFLRSSKVDVLSDAIEKLDRFSDQLESLLYPTASLGPESATTQPSQSNRFSLGLIRGRSSLERVTLFNLPNLGNLPFSFVVVAQQQRLILPSDCPPVTTSPFSVAPTFGVVQPGESICLYAGFSAFESGQYSQLFDIQSDGHSVLQFTVVAEVGNAKLLLEPSNVDFGLLPIKQHTKKTIRLSNVGTYIDNFSISQQGTTFLGEVQPESTVFVLAPEEGSVDVKETVMLELQFEPQERGEYTTTFTLNCTQGSKPIIVTGTGAAPVFQFGGDVVTGDAGMEIDFGICLVGVQQQRQLTITNTGTAIGEFSTKCPDEHLQVLIPDSSSPITRLDVDKTIEVVFQMQPVAVCEINTLFEMTSRDGQEFSVAITGRCGRFAPLLEGALEPKSLRVDEVHISSIVVSNGGDFPFRIHADIQPETVRDIFNVEGLLENIPIESSGQRPLAVAVAPRLDGQYKGVIRLVCTFLEQQEVFELPFSFRCFSRPLSLDSDDKIDVGRVTVGQSVQTNRHVTNFGRDAFRYRCRVIGPGGSAATAVDTSQAVAAATPKKAGGKGAAAKKRANANGRAETAQESPVSMAWKIVSLPESVIQPEDVHDVTIVFTAEEKAGKDWLDGTVQIEYLENPNSTDWMLLAAIPIHGAVGSPVPVFSKDNVDFGFVPIGRSKTTAVTLANEGTSLMDYTIESPWAYDDAFKLSEETPLSGQVPPGQQVHIPMVFSPPIQFAFATEVVVRTNFESHKIVYRGEGCVVRIAHTRLPKSIDLEAFFDESFQYEFTVYNDCVFTMDMECLVSRLAEYSADAADHDIEPAIVPSPQAFQLAPSPVADTSGLVGADHEASCTLTLTGQFPVPTAPDGSTDFEAAINAAPATVYTYIVCSSLDSLVYGIPLTVSFKTRPLQLVHDVGDQPDAPLLPLTALEFGEVPCEHSQTLNLLLSNPNSFSVPFTATTNSPRFSVEPQHGQVSGEGLKRIQVTMVPITYGETDDIPLLAQVSGELSLKVSSEAPLCVRLSGAFADIVVQPEFSPIDFGAVLCDSVSTYQLTVPNGTRSALTYELSLDRSLAGAVQIQPNLLSGRILPKRSITVPVAFAPQSAFQFAGTLTVVTSTGAFPIQVTGTGVAPVVAADPANLSFGVVGIGQPSFRIFTMTNTCICPLSLTLEGEHAVYTVKPRDAKLEAGQATDFAVTFEPLLAQEYTAAFRLYHTNASPAPGTSGRKHLQTINVTGKGGIMHFGWKEKAQEDGKMPLAFGKVGHLEVSTTTRTLVNSGQTELEYAFVYGAGDDGAMQSGKEVSGKNSVASFSVNPAYGILQAGQEQTFKINAMGLSEGSEEFEFRFILRHQVDLRAMQAYVKADGSIEDKLDYNRQEARSYRSDENFWKLLIPVVRVGGKLPSQEVPVALQAVQPDLTYAPIQHLVTRPPALPRDLKKIGAGAGGRTKRVAASLEPTTQSSEAEALLAEKEAAKTTDEARLRFERRREAAMMLRAVERAVSLATKATESKKWK